MQQDLLCLLPRIQERIVKVIEVGRVCDVSSLCIRRRNFICFRHVDCPPLWLDTSNHLRWIYAEQPPTLID